MLTKIRRLLNVPISVRDAFLIFVFSALAQASVAPDALARDAQTASPALASALASASAPGADSRLIAARITAENFGSHHVGGPDSDAGIDDWFLSNGVLCAAVSDPDHESAITPRGGVLIDLGHCGAEDDQFAVLQPILNLSQSQVVPVTSVEAGADSEKAWIRTRAFFSGIEIEATYALDLVTPTALSVSVLARRIAEGGALYSVGAILLHPAGQTPVFSLLRSDLSRSVGFKYTKIDRRSIQSMLAALTSSDLTVLVGADGYPPISYGLARDLSMLASEAEDKPAPLASFSVTGKDFTALNTLTSPLWFGETNQPPGLLQLGQLPFMDVEPQTAITEEYKIWVADRADVAAITNRVFREAQPVQGKVDDPTARVHIRLKSGAPVSQIRPDADGKYELRLPAGEYIAEARADGERVVEAAFGVPAATVDDTLTIPPLVLGATGFVALPSDFTGRAVFLNEDGSGPAVFHRNHLGFAIGEERVKSGLEAPFINLAADSLATRPPLPIKPGRYRVLATRGHEYGAHASEITIEAGKTSGLELPPLPRVVETPGWISADFHVHSGESFDSSLPQNEQIIAFAANGTEVLVATEHDRIFDPQPAIIATGLSENMRSVLGVEITSAYEGGDSPFASGHLNAFPVEAEPQAYRGGAPSLEGRRVRDAVFDAQSKYPGVFVQMNHPRPAPIQGEGDLYFTHLGVAGQPFDPTLSLDTFPNSVLIERSPRHGRRDADYHGVELMNGHDLTRYRRTRADWFSMLLQGERRVATANSDSHQLSRVVGMPRTYVEVADDSLAGYDEKALITSLHAGRAYGTTGPLLRTRLNQAGLGDLHGGTSGTLVVEIEAAPWVPLTQWRVYVNGERVHAGEIPENGLCELPLAFAGDAFVTVEVEGEASGLYADLLPDYTPFAFTNPIFVDADGNGQFDAPGLPAQIPTTITHPDRVQ
ncbi:MAG: CehA/McbA family metallohydrolase [Myxococcota bacterium]